MPCFVSCRPIYLFKNKKPLPSPCTPEQFKSKYATGNNDKRSNVICKNNGYYAIERCIGVKRTSFEISFGVGKNPETNDTIIKRVTRIHNYAKTNNIVACLRNSSIFMCLFDRRKIRTLPLSLS